MHNTRRTAIIGAFLLAFLISLLPRLSAAASVSAGAPASAAGARLDQVPRFFAARLNIYGIDDDWPDPDDTTNRFYGPFEKVMDDNNRVFTFPIEPERWGGECRVEVEGIKAVLQSDGAIEFTGFVRFYEGTDEDTTDLEDAKQLEFTIPRKASDVRYQVRLTSEHGDYADIKWSFDNVVNE